MTKELVRPFGLQNTIWEHHRICAKEIGAHKATHMLKVNEIDMSDPLVL